VIQTVTLSKAFGAYGGAILGSAALRRRICERSRAFVGSTPLPLPLASAALRSTRLLAADPGFRQRLAHNLAYVRGKLRQAGFPVAGTPGPIVPFLPQSRRQLAKLKGALLKAGIYPPFIKYPTGPASGYFRFMISSEHTEAQLDCLSNVLGNAL
jgi:7-keto-8-aminopelargonate synthetase-like enzyme